MNPGPRRRHSQLGALSPLVIGILVLAAALATVTVVVFNRDNSAQPLAVVVTPTPVPTAAPTATADPTPVAGQDSTRCAGKKFGQHLAPLNPPSDIHTYSAEPPMTI